MQKNIAAIKVVICFKISIFALSDTTRWCMNIQTEALWFALKLVSLHYQTQQTLVYQFTQGVVICFKISIFALSDTTPSADFDALG